MTAIRVGSGSRLFSSLILREFSGLPDTVPVELVNEAHTSLLGGPNADMFSAIIIAGRSGRPVSERDANLEAKAGNIRAIKSLASKLTHGTRKITSKDARKVIEGDLSLDALLDAKS
jgi:hypothetical protein